MDALRVAVPLARLLLTLGETRRDGELLVEQRARAARLSVSAGRLTAISGVDVEPLGDTLAALGALDLGAQRALRANRGAALIGARLIAAGATSAAAVIQALELQRWRGLSALLRWPASRVHWVARATRSERVRAGSVDLVAGVWSALFSLACELPASAIEQLAGSNALILTGAGRRRAQGLLEAGERGDLARALELAPPPPTTAQLAPSAETLARALAPRPPLDLYAMRALLRVLGVALAPAERDDAYALLLRKRRELAQNVSARRLLDLPEQADADHARRALRRLAGKLHPDRFQAADARLHAVSTEVMGALARAERELCPREVRELR